MTIREIFVGITVSNMIKTFRNVFTNEEQDEIWKYLRSDKWAFGQTSNQNSQKKFWIMNLSDVEYFTDYLFKKVEDITESKFILERVYANGQTYGLDGEFHVDSNLPNAYTFLYYPHIIWKKEWGGNLIIVDGNEEKFFYPNPNTAVFFPGTKLHRGMGPNRSFYDLRMSIAFKLVQQGG